MGTQTGINGHVLLFAAAGSAEWVKRSILQSSQCVNGFTFQTDSIKSLNRAIRHMHFGLARSPVHRLNWIPRSLYEMDELIARSLIHRFVT